MTDKALAAKCRRLAKKLGCTIEVERMEGYNNYWVIGPDHVYGAETEDNDGTPKRIDPHEGDHICCDWSEVWENLKDYETDLWFRFWGINSDDTYDILNTPSPGLRDAWIESGYGEHERAVFVDWIEEQGDQRLAELFRFGAPDPVVK